MKTLSNSKWLETRDQNLWLYTFCSTRDRRLVFYAQGNLQIKPVGDHLVNPLDGVKAIGMVAMTPKAIDVEMPPSLHSKDGVRLQARISATIAISDDDASIRRVALAPEDQEKIVEDAIIAAFQQTCSEIEYLTLAVQLHKVATDTTRLTTQGLSGQQAAFQIRSIAIHDLRTKDEGLDRVLLDRAKRVEETKLAEQDAAARMKILEHEMEVEKLRAEAERERLRLDADAERLRQSLNADERRKQEEKDMELAKQRAVIAGLKDGLFVLDPERAMQIKLAELKFEHDAKLLQIRLEDESRKANEKFLLQMAPHIVAGAKKDGKMEVLAGIVNRQFGMNLRVDEPSALPLPDDGISTESNVPNESTAFTGETDSSMSAPTGTASGD